MARAFLASQLCGEHTKELADEAALLTSEAVTNAVRYGGPPITLSVECSSDWVEVRVHDASSVPPRHVTANPFATHGRGVDLIDALSDTWGVHQHENDGKDVWFRLAN